MKDAERWLDRLEAAGLDGVVAKRLGLPYLPGSREGVVKVKKYKTADCVIVGFRYSEKEEGRISTLLLGLYDDDGELDFVGHCSAMPAAVRKQIEAELPKLLEPGFLSDKRIPGGQSRWTQGKELDWNPVRPRARLRGPLRQARAEPLPPRDEASSASAPTRIPKAVHVARGEAAAAPRRPDSRVASHRLTEYRQRKILRPSSVPLQTDGKESTMADEQPTIEEQDELEKEKLADLDVPEDVTEDVKGGLTHRKAGRGQQEY